MVQRLFTLKESNGFEIFKFLQFFSVRTEVSLPYVYRHRALWIKILIRKHFNIKLNLTLEGFMKQYSLFALIFLFSSLGYAKPILNQTVGLNSPIFEPIHPDSEDPNVYWTHITEFRFCTPNDYPVFAIRAFKSNEIPRTFLTFDLCGYKDPNKLIQYRALLKEINPNAELRLIAAFYPEAPKITFFMQKELGIQSSCTATGYLQFSCAAFAVGERRADRLYNMFRWSQALLIAENLNYKVDGVEIDETGKSTEIFKDFNAIAYVRGLSDYPELFDTEWKPEID